MKKVNIFISIYKGVLDFFLNSYIIYIKKFKCKEK